MYATVHQWRLHGFLAFSTIGMCKPTGVKKRFHWVVSHSVPRQMSAKVKTKKSWQFSFFSNNTTLVLDIIGWSSTWSDSSVNLCTGNITFHLWILCSYLIYLSQTNRISSSHWRSYRHISLTGTSQFFQRIIPTHNSSLEHLTVVRYCIVKTQMLRASGKLSCSK